MRMLKLLSAAVLASAALGASAAPGDPIKVVY